MSEEITPIPKLVQEEQNLAGDFRWPFHLLRDRVRRSKKNLIWIIGVAGFILAIGVVFAVILAAGILDNIFN